MHCVIQLGKGTQGGAEVTEKHREKREASAGVVKKRTQEDAEAILGLCWATPSKHEAELWIDM